MQVPGFLLRRLYVKRSLRNVDGGFAFDLSNSLGSGYAEQVMPITVDGEELPLDVTTFTVDGERVRSSDVSPEHPLTLAMKKTVTVAVDGRTLDEGKHKIGIGFVVTGMGKLQFDVTDAVGGGDDGDGDEDAA